MKELYLLLGILVTSGLAGRIVATEPEPPEIVRYVAVDNVCAWPNLTLLTDGTIVAILHNQPSHSGLPGDLDCWASADGVHWERRGRPAPHEPETVRMNMAGGRAANGDLIVICSGWTMDSPRKILPAWVSRSRDGGRTWSIDRSFLDPEPGWTHFVPFGPIVPGEDGRLHTTCFAQGAQDSAARRLWHFTSADDGRTWQRGTLMGTAHSETAILPLGGSRWLAAARTRQSRVELLRSDDHGDTWQGGEPVTQPREINAHLLRLQDGRILLSYGKRLEGHSGVLAKFSRDEGRTWSEPVRIMNSLSTDCGYPSSVQRRDGKIVTAYYSQSVENHERYHMGVAIWSAPALPD